ncbi:MAG: TRAP transporter permease [Syntrophobacteraceae bacterium]|nr:TRAP transporter permease [Syntrophobacteraceae bacterium]
MKSSAGVEDMEPVVTEEELNEILKKVDKESTYRNLGGYQRRIVFWVAVGFSLFQVYTGAFGMLAAQMQRSIHLAFAFTLVFLLYPFRLKGASDRLAWHHYVFAAFAGLIGLYMTLNYTRIMEAGGDFSRMDYVAGSIGVLLTLEAARRVVGMPMVIIASIFLLYAYFGPYFPGFMTHRGYSIQRIVSHMYFTTEGILGIPLGVSASFIFLFILFRTFLDRTGIAKLFIDIANSIAGWASGGPAKVAVISSALEGTYSGSSVANTVGSGSFTIPMMKKLGYRPEFAGAVEASASTGGQIMPPIMGAAAFLMAEFLGIPYIEIAKAAAIPACLYFIGVLIEVHLEAKRCGLRGMSREEIPRFLDVVKYRIHLFIPMVVLFYILIEGYTPSFAALMGLLVAILAGLPLKETRMGVRDILEALEAGARGALGVAIACATAGIMVGVVTLTGIGLKMAGGLVDLAGGNLLLSLVFTMIASIILGMGVPTTATYVICSTIAAPALVLQGVPVLAAHMFVFYFGIVADITPPVALAAYAGASIARANPFRTAVESTKLAIGAVIVPYVFCYSPSLLLINSTPLQLTQNLITASCGMFGVGAAMIGYCWTHMHALERLLFLGAGLMLIDPGTYSDIAGLCLLALGAGLQWQKHKRESAKA